MFKFGEPLSIERQHANNQSQSLSKFQSQEFQVILILLKRNNRKEEREKQQQEA